MCNKLNGAKLSAGYSPTLLMIFVFTSVSQTLLKINYWKDLSLKAHNTRTCFNRYIKTVKDRVEQIKSNNL